MTEQEILENLYSAIKPIEEKIEEMTGFKTENRGLYNRLCMTIALHFIYAVTFDTTQAERQPFYDRLIDANESRFEGVYLEGDDTLVGVEP